MRTVILNTLGSELRQTSLFYLPFREEQFQWVDIDLPHLGEATELISANSFDQGQIQDYHLVVLVSLSRYRHCRFERLRNVCKDLLKAHVNHALVLPMAEKQNLPPQAVSIVFVTPHRVNGDGSVADGQELDALLGFVDQEQITSLVLTADNGEQLDMTGYFRMALEEYASKRPKERERNAELNVEKNGSLEVMRSRLKELLAERCHCRYFTPGEERMRDIDSEVVDFFPKTTNWELFSVDLQINLCDHLTAAVEGADWHLDLQPHEEKEIQKRIAYALRRVRLLRDSADRVTYYPMEPLTDTLDAADLSANIWEKLRKYTTSPHCVGLPGVDDLNAIMNDTYNPGALAEEDEKKKTGVRLFFERMLLVVAKRKFKNQCDVFAEQYNPDKAQAQQMIVLDTCAEVFKDWRVRMLRRQEEGFGAPTLPEMPDYNPQKAREELEQAQREYGEVCVERLEDYEDLRKEAEEIKAQFRRDTRLWPKEGAASDWWFLLYSGILAILFLLQMILPFVGITVKTASAQMSGYIHLGVSIAVFAGLYAVGLVIWSHVLCSRVCKHVLAMHNLVVRSRARRRRSILNAVETYGKRLPACMIKYENLKRLERIYAANLLRKNHYHTHVQILDKAEEILQEMQTQLRLPRGIDVEDDKQPKKKIDYQRAPSDPENVPLYIFLSDKWGGD